MAFSIIGLKDPRENNNPLALFSSSLPPYTPAKIFAVTSCRETHLEHISVSE